MRHLFLKKNPLTLRHQASQAHSDFSPVGFADCDHFVRAGMSFASCLQVTGVKGLIDDNRIRPISPRAHHRGRDVPRTRPHRDADGLSHGQRLSRAGNFASVEIGCFATLDRADYAI